MAAAVASATTIGIPNIDEPLEELVDIDERRIEMRKNARDCVLIIDGLPIIPSEKYVALKKVILKKLPGKLKKTKDKLDVIHMPQDENGGTLGYAFVQYANPDEAVRASRALHGHRFDRNHTYWAMTEYDFKILEKTEERFVAPKIMDVKELEERVNFKSWLVDGRGRDQFMIRAGAETSIYWHDPVLKPELVSCFLYLLLVGRGFGAVMKPFGTFHFS